MVDRARLKHMEAPGLILQQIIRQVEKAENSTYLGESENFLIDIC